MSTQACRLAGYMFVVSSTVIVSAWAESACWMYTGERQLFKLRSTFIKAVLSQEVGFFEKDSKVSEIVGNISIDISVVHDVISFKMGKFLRFVTTFLSSLCVGLFYCYPVALLTMATVPITMVLAGMYNNAAKKLATELRDSIANASNILEETLSQIRTILSYTCEEQQNQKYGEALDERAKLGAQAGLTKGLGLGSLIATANLSWALLLWFGGVLINRQQMQAGNIITAIFSVVYAGTAMGSAMQCLQSFAEGKASGVKLFSLIKREPLIQTAKEGKRLSPVRGSIKLENVSFRYESRPDVLILDNVSLRIPPGKVLAIVGGSGSGKSTVLSLIERYYDPEKGNIYLDGVNFKDLDLGWLRGCIGLVGQEPALFATSIFENIAFGRQSATMKEIEAACKAANVQSFVTRLPDGYNTQVGERGLQLSGGQKQRLAIARAILKNPAILLLDEATSALDTESERLVQEALDGFMLGRTTVVVAHRLSTIRHADTIVVLQKGQVVQAGSHDSLMMDRRGVYFSLVNSQGMQKVQRVSPDHWRGLVSSTGWRLSAPPTPLDNILEYYSTVSSLPSMSPMVLGTPLCSHVSMESRLHTSIKAPSVIVENQSKNVPKRAVNLISIVIKLACASKKKETALGTIGAILSGSTMPFFLFFLYDVCISYIDTNKAQRDNKVHRFVIVLACLGVISFLANLIQHYNLAKIGEFLTSRMLKGMFEAILQKPVSWFDQDENNSAILLQLFISSTKPSKVIVTDFAGTIIRTMATVIVAIALAFVATWRIALLILAIWPILTYGTFQRTKDANYAHSEEMKKASSAASMIAAEAVSNIRTVASFTAEEKVLNRFMESLEEPYIKNKKKSLWIGLTIALGQISVYFSVCLTLYVSGVLVGAKKASFLRCLQAFQAFNYAADVFGEAMSVLSIIPSAREAFFSAFSIMGEKAQAASSGVGETLESFHGHVEFRRVNFMYPSRPDIVVLRDFSLSIQAGKTTALVGKSGSGKSSAISLLQRFYEPQSGQIKVDGRDICELSLQWLRMHMALVQQEPVLFTQTVEENIRCGDENATEIDIMKAARTANAHGFITSLPSGYQTSVGSKGVQLSGGQKQRIAIARAVLRKPKILLLDEATSALDTRSEALVQEALDSLTAHTRATVLVVAHRLSTIRSADLIAVVDHGCVKELGSHNQLMQSGGLYAELVHIQDVKSSSIEAE